MNEFAHLLASNHTLIIMHMLASFRHIMICTRTPRSVHLVKVLADLAAPYCAVCALQDTCIQKTQLVVFPQTQNDVILTFTIQQQVAKHMVNRALCSPLSMWMLSEMLSGYVQIGRIGRGVLLQQIQECYGKVPYH